MIRLFVCLCLGVFCFQTESHAEVQLGNVRMVIGSSSTGGDTYLASSIIAKELAKKLNTSIKVDAVGAIEAFKLLKRNSDGHTIMVFHDQAYLGHIYQHKGYFDIFDELIIGSTFASNPGNAYLVPKHSPLKNFNDVLDKLNREEVVKVAIQPGGVSEIGFSAMKNAVKIKYPGREKYLQPLKTGSQSDLNQQLFDGQADIIYGSVQANEAYTHLPKEDVKAMRFLWLTAADSTMLKTKVEGYGQTPQSQLMQYVTPNVNVPLDKEKNFIFDKEFYFLFNRDTAPEILSLYEDKLTEVFLEGAIQKTLANSFFSANFRSFQDSQDYLKHKSTGIAQLLESIKTDSSALDAKTYEDALLPMKVDAERAHQFFPKIILFLGGFVLICIGLSQGRELMSKCSDLKSELKQLFSKKSWRAGVCFGLLVIYFVSMTMVGQMFPNRGYGFLICSMPFMWLLSILFSEELTKKKCLVYSISSVLTPSLSWYVFSQLLAISLP